MIAIKAVMIAIEKRHKLRTCISVQRRKKKQKEKKEKEKKKNEEEMCMLWHNIHTCSSLNYYSSLQILLVG